MRSDDGDGGKEVRVKGFGGNNGWMDWKSRRESGRAHHCPFGTASGLGCRSNHSAQRPKKKKFLTFKSTTIAFRKN